MSFAFFGLTVAPPVARPAASLATPHGRLRSRSDTQRAPATLTPPKAIESGAHAPAVTDPLRVPALRG